MRLREREKKREIETRSRERESRERQTEAAGKGQATERREKSRGSFLPTFQKDGFIGWLTGLVGCDLVWSGWVWILGTVLRTRSRSSIMAVYTIHNIPRLHNIEEASRGTVHRKRKTLDLPSFIH